MRAGQGWDVAEMKQTAQRLVVAGRLEKAEVLYRQLQTRVPRDASVWVRHAEVLKRLGRGDRAAWSYRAAAGLYVALGHPARAIASLKLALELVPDDIDVVTELIRLEMHRAVTHQAPRRTLAAPTGSAPVPLSSLEEPQLALPMLSTPVDVQASSGSAVLALPSQRDVPTPALTPPLNGPLSTPPRYIEVRLPDATTREALSSVAGGADAHELPPDARWPQVRRVSSWQVAIKTSPFSGWILVSSTSPVEVSFDETASIPAEARFLG